MNSGFFKIYFINSSTQDSLLAASQILPALTAEILFDFFVKHVPVPDLPDKYKY